MTDLIWFQDRYNEFIQIQYRILETLEEISKKIDSAAQSQEKQSLMKCPPKKPEEKTAGSLAWDLYSENYSKRHGVPPVRNAKSNALCKQLVQRLGVEATDVAGFYPHHPDPFYARSRHPLELLVRDAEKIRTDWKTRRTITTVEAKGQERVAHAKSQIERIEMGEI